MLNNIVDNLEQFGQQNIVQCCFHQARTGCAFFAVYTDRVFVVSSNYWTLFMLVYLSQHFWNEHLKISKILVAKLWSKNLVKYGKYSLAKFVSDVFVLQAEKVTVLTAKTVTFSARDTSTSNANFARLYFPHFITKLCNFINVISCSF